MAESYKQATSAYTGKVSQEILKAVKAEYGERIELLESMAFSGRYFAPLLDSQGNAVLDSTGKVVVAEWQT